VKRRKCKNCNELFVITPRQPDQEYCRRKECQRARKTQWQRRKLSSDNDYRENQADCQARWAAKNPGYWKRYRENHPESAQRNREKQSVRNRINRKQPPAKSMLPTIENMDAKHPKKLSISGYYELTPIASPPFANMAPIVVRIDEAIYSRSFPVDLPKTKSLHNAPSCGT